MEQKLQSSLPGAPSVSEQLHHLAGLVHGLPGVFYLLNKAGEIVLWNDWLERLSGYSADELRGASALMFIEEDDRANVQERVRQAFSRGYSRVEARFITKAGERIATLLEARVVEFDGEKHLAGVAVDISELKKTEDGLRESEARYRAVIEDQTEFIVRGLPDGTRTFVNAAFCRYFGKSEEEILGSNFYEGVAEEHREKLREKIAALTPAQSYAMSQHLAVLPDGSKRWHEWVDRGIFNGNGNLIEVQAVGRDITELRRLSDDLLQQKTQDPLTGLANRAEFSRRLNELVVETQDKPDQHTLCYLKISHLRIINSAGGYAGGDAFIQAVSQLLSKHTRAGDTLARVGGDEFAILMPQCALTDAWRAVQRFRGEAELFTFEWGERTFDLTFSAGLAPVDETSEGAEQALRTAAAACAIARESGPNQIETAHPQDSEVQRRYKDMDWVSQINRALGEGRFRLAVQRIVPITNGDQGKDHYEVLLRLEDAEGNLVSPGAFLPAAERFGLSRKLDRWVIESTFSWLARYPRILSDIEAISINLSGLSFGNTELQRFIEGRLGENSIPPDKICFEVTETAAIGDFGKALQFINAIRRHGCRFSLDDFGSGLSSFAYLKNLPVDYLKIDGLFVKTIAEDPIDYSLVKSMHEIGRAVGKKTIAEFVENEVILEKLREIGVDYAQGYGIAKPQSIDSLLS